MKQFFGLVAGTLCLGLVSCGGGGGQSSSTPPGSGSGSSSVTVSVSPSSASLQISLTQQNSQQFLATVTNATNLAVTWQVNGVTGGNSSVGLISPAGLYSAPQSLPIPNPVTVTAVTVADPTKSASATVTITAPVAISISPSNANVAYGGTQQFTATLQNTSNTAVTWQIVFGSGTGNSNGTISSSGLYTAPPSGTLFSSLMITATSVVDPREVASATITLTGPPGPKDNELNGRYAFSLKGEYFHGFNSNFPLQPTTIAGSFQADGAGNLTGEADWIQFPTGGVPVSPIHETIAGAYTVGADGRGTLALFGPDVGGIFRFALGTVVQGVATQGRFIEFDSSPVNISLDANVTTGTLEKQDVSAFSTAAINGDFSFGFSATSFNEFAAVGRFHADGNGNLTAGSLDTNELNALETPLLLSGQPFTGSYGAVDSGGRGTAVFAIPGVGNVTTLFYVVSNTELLFIGGGIPDNGAKNGNGATIYHGIFAGAALRQAGGPFSNASLNGNSVFQLYGSNPNLTSRDELVAGEIVADGSGNLTGVIDEDLNGSVSLNTAVTGTYAISANGRGIVASPSGGPLVLYMVSPNQAFLLHPPPGDPQIGLLQPQAPGPFSAASISGAFTGGTSRSVEPFDPSPIPGNPPNGIAAATGVFSFDGAGNASGTVDLSASSYINSTLGFMAPDETFQATYTVAANGRGTMTVTSLAGGSYVLYVISPANFFTMYVGPLSSTFQPGLVLTK